MVPTGMHQPSGMQPVTIYDVLNNSESHCVITNADGSHMALVIDKKQDFIQFGKFAGKVFVLYQEFMLGLTKENQCQS